MAGRVSTDQMFQSAQKSISTAREREAINSEKSSTGKEIVRPSQNPGGYIIANRLKDEMSSRDSMARSANLAYNVLAMHETIFTQVQEIAQRAKEIAVSAAGDDPNADAARKLALKEVENLYAGAIQSLNTRYANRTLLAGFRSDSPAFDNQGNFVGDTGQIEIEIAPGMKIPINVTADRAVQGVGIGNGVNVLEVIKRLENGMRTNDTEMIRSTLVDLDRANDQMSFIRGEVGARQEQIRQGLAAHGDASLNMIDEISKIEDADAVKVFSDLSRDQTVLRAAISTSDKILNHNPTDLLFK